MQRPRVAQHSVDLVGQHDGLVGSVSGNGDNAADSLRNGAFLDDREELGLSEIAEMRSAAELNGVVHPARIAGVCEQLLDRDADGDHADHIGVVLHIMCGTNSLPLRTPRGASRSCGPRRWGRPSCTPSARRAPSRSPDARSRSAAQETPLSCG